MFCHMSAHMRVHCREPHVPCDPRPCLASHGPALRAWDLTSRSAGCPGTAKDASAVKSSSPLRRLRRQRPRRRRRCHWFSKATSNGRCETLRLPLHLRAHLEFSAHPPARTNPLHVVSQVTTLCDHTSCFFPRNAHRGSRPCLRDTWTPNAHCAEETRHSKRSLQHRRRRRGSAGNRSSTGTCADGVCERAAHNYVFRDSKLCPIPSHQHNVRSRENMLTNERSLG